MKRRSRIVDSAVLLATLGCSDRSTPAEHVASDTEPLLSAASRGTRDFNGDARDDLVYFRPSEQAIYWRSVEGTASGGPIRDVCLLASDIFVPGDYDGDSKADVACFRPDDGFWSVKNSSTGEIVHTQFGAGADRPVPGDYDADGKTDRAVFRPSESKWHVLASGGVYFAPVQFGEATDRTMQADYDGDGKTDIAVFRPRTNAWYVHPTTGGADWVVNAGTRVDRLVPADYNGDGKTDFGYVSRTDGKWRALTRTGSGVITDTSFGTFTDRMVPGRYDGDNKADIAVFRVDPADPEGDGQWAIKRSAGGTDIWLSFGRGSDVVPSHFGRRRASVDQDYDGDERADAVLFRGSDAADWFVRLAGGAMPPGVNYGELYDRVLHGDYDGDRRNDYSLYRNREKVWYVKPMSGAAELAVPMAEPSDVMVAGDYDGDGRTDRAAFTPSTGRWRIHTTRWGTQTKYFGGPGDHPVPGDYDGDGKADLALFRASAGTWFYQRSAGGADGVVPFGEATDVPLPQDYDGDGRTDPALFRFNDSTWYVRPSRGGADLWFRVTDNPTWGNVLKQANTRYAPADYDGDGRADLAFFAQPTAGATMKWVVFGSGTGDLWNHTAPVVYPQTSFDFGLAPDQVPASNEFEQFCTTSSLGNSNQSVSCGSTSLLPPPANLDICEKVIQSVNPTQLARCGNCEWYSFHCCTPGSCLLFPDCVIWEAGRYATHADQIVCEMENVGPSQFMRDVGSGRYTNWEALLAVPAGTGVHLMIEGVVSHLACAGDRLPDALKRVLRNIARWPGAPAGLLEDIDLARVRIISENEKEAGLFLNQKSGITLDNVVVLRDRLYQALKNWTADCNTVVHFLNPDQLEALSVIVHELVHVRQYRIMGREQFFQDYFYQTIQEGGYGSDMPIEQEAYEVQDWLHTMLARAQRGLGP